MHTLFAFSIIAAIPMIVMWLSYCIFLSKSRKPGFNRLFLLAGIAAMALAFSVGRRFPVSVPEGAAAITKISSFANAAAAQPQAIEAAPAPHENTAPAYEKPREGHLGVWGILLMCYKAGVATMLLAFAGSMIRIAHIISKCERMSKGGLRLYITRREDISPFSIGNAIVLSRKDYERGADMIIAHEMGHILHRHTIDMAIAQLLVTICWYNPAAWLLRKEMVITHEYQADAYAIGNGFDRFEYQKLLLDISSSRLQPFLANNFNYLNIKKRFIMMNSTEPIKSSILAALMPILLLSGAILFSCSNSNVRETAEQTLAAGDTAYNNLFLIRGVDVDARALADSNFIYVGDLAYADRPDSSFDGIVYPITHSVATYKKGTIDMLAPADAEYVIDSKKATKEQYAELGEEAIQLVALDGNKVEIYTRRDINEPNADVTANGNEESRRLHALIASLSEAWPGLAAVVVDGAEYPIEGADMEKFNALHPGLINAVESVSVSGGKAIITTWGKK